MPKSGKCVRTTLKNFKKFNSAIESPRSGAPKKTTYYDNKCYFRQARLYPTISNQNLDSEFNSRSANVQFCKDRSKKTSFKSTR